MIHYELRCTEGHAFDGWFPGSAAFDAQCTAGQVECPACGSVRVTRALMAPAVARGTVRPVAGEILPPARPVPAAPPPAALPAEMVAALQRLRQVVERECEDVGTDFADQARRMHRGEIDARSIYGHTDADDADLLREEGIAFGRLPWIKRADS